MVGHKAREVRLDAQHKVIFSVSDNSFARTGKHSGFGYPEILCDENHASVLLPFLGAAMRKVPKTSADRDAVANPFMRLVRFCRLMAAATTCSQADLAGILAEEAGFQADPFG